MSTVTRICPQCGHGNTMDARYCAQCGYDAQANLPATQQNNLPALISKAAVPVLVGAASVAVSVGWKLLQAMLTKPAAQPPIQVKKGEIEKRSRPTIRIRTAWAVGDSNGHWQRGQTEHTIEFDE
jgi:hypothetical protein